MQSISSIVGQVQVRRSITSFGEHARLEAVDVVKIADNANFGKEATEKLNSRFDQDMAGLFLLVRLNADVAADRATTVGRKR